MAAALQHWDGWEVKERMDVMQAHARVRYQVSKQLSSEIDALIARLHLNGITLTRSLLTSSVLEITFPMMIEDEEIGLQVARAIVSNVVCAAVGGEITHLEIIRTQPLSPPPAPLDADFD